MSAFRGAAEGASALAAIGLSLLYAFGGSAPLRIYPGPADPAYSVELPARYRVAEPPYFRWTGREAGFDLPFRLRAPATLTLHYQLGRPSTPLAVLLDGEPAGTTTLFQGASKTRLVLSAGRALRLRFRGEPAAERLRASFFLVQIDAPAGGVVPSAPAVAAAAALPLIVLLLLLCARMPFRWAAALAVAVALVDALLIRADPYGTVRLIERLLPPTALVGGLAAVALGRRAPAWLFAAFLFGLLLRLGIVLHPFAYHYDHASHVTLVQVALQGGARELWERKEELQVALNVGEMNLAGKKLAFPYPTPFFLASAALTRLVGSPDYAVMLLAAVVAALEVFVVAWLCGTLLSGERAKLYAAWAAALYPASYGVLTIALYPSLVAHVAETLAMALLARGERAPSALVVGSVSLAASLHAAVPFNLTAFALMLALVSRKPRPLAIIGAGLGLSFLISYRSFPRLLPHILASLGHRPLSDWLKVEPPQQFAFMGGYVWLVVGALGLLLTQKPESRKFLLAWVLSFLALRGIRILLGPAGGDHLKELQWVAPLVSLGIGQGLDCASVGRGWVGPTALAALAFGALLWIFEHERWLWPLAFL